MGAGCGPTLGIELLDAEYFGERVKALGLVSEIILWKPRLFVPTSAAGPAILAQLRGLASTHLHRRQSGDVIVRWT
jgi:hypothetical protein